ncbi:MAG: hypothetical protein QOH23_2506 [Gaiellaceae bacterium]|nr:hypothetical protein [Gaiellaceae bacterium]
MGLDRLSAIALAAVVLAGGCRDGGKLATPERLLYGEPVQTFAPVPGSVVAAGRVLDATTLGRRFASCSPAADANAAVVVERIGVFSESLSFTNKRGTALYSCDGGDDPSRERAPPWCGRSVGRLLHGRLIDPRLDILCRERNGRPLAYLWVDPVRQAHWIGVDQGAYSELYEVLAGLPVRVATNRGIQLGRASARLVVAQYDAHGKPLLQGIVEAAVAG